MENFGKFRRPFSLTLVATIVAAFMALPQNVNSQERPCQRADAVVVPLPKSAECLLYEREEKHWTEAQKVCERGGGELLRLDGQGAGAQRLGLDQAVRDCLYANLSTGGKVDFWVGAVSQWSPRWTWVDGSTLSLERGCTVQTLDGMLPGFCSRYLSVDFCVARCSLRAGASSTLLHRKTSTPCCYCAGAVEEELQGCAPYRHDTPQGNTTWVFSTVPEDGMGLRLDSSEVLSSTETLCAAVSQQTAASREFLTEPCFTRNRYVCDLSTGNGCSSRVAGRCLYVGDTARTWMEARDDCRARGGDLVVVKGPQLLSQLPGSLPEAHSYWVGASDHAWNFAPDSAVFGEQADKESNTCGHMFYQKELWDWSDSRCDVRKPFLCRYPDPASRADATTNDPSVPEVKCLWNVTVRTCGAADQPCTPLPPSAPSVIVDSTFPLAAVIAASVVGLLTLLTLLMLLGCSRRRGWFRKKDLSRHPSNASSRTPRRIIKRWSASYGQYPDHLSDFDTMSTGHTNVFSDLSFISLPNVAYYNSAVTPESPGWVYGYSSLPRPLSEPGGRMVKESFKEEKTETKEINGAPPHDVSSMQGSELPLDLKPPPQALYRGGEAEEKEYETLMARMDFRDELESRPSSLRMKPEVALATSDVDMNFTVNHLRAKKPQSPSASVHDLHEPHETHETHERTLEEIELPMGNTVEVPVYANESPQILY